MVLEEGIVVVHEDAVLQQRLTKPAVKFSDSGHVLMDEVPDILHTTCALNGTRGVLYPTLGQAWSGSQHLVIGGGVKMLS